MKGYELICLRPVLVAIRMIAFFALSIEFCLMAILSTQIGGQIVSTFGGLLMLVVVFFTFGRATVATRHGAVKSVTRRRWVAVANAGDIGRGGVGRPDTRCIVFARDLSSGDLIKVAECAPVAFLGFVSRRHLRLLDESVLRVRRAVTLPGQPGR